MGFWGPVRSQPRGDGGGQCAKARASTELTRSVLWDRPHSWSKEEEKNGFKKVLQAAEFLTFLLTSLLSYHTMLANGADDNTSTRGTQREPLDY